MHPANASDMSVRLHVVACSLALALGACAANAARPVTPVAALNAVRPHSATPAPCTQPAPNAADPNAPHGLMVWLDSVDAAKNDPAILKYLRTDPNLCGASIVVLWSAIDHGPASSNQYDFQPIERAMAPWIAAGKIVNLLFTGVDEVGPTDRATPAWVLAQKGANHVDVVPCPNPGSGSVGPPTPVYWEQGYSTPWRAFIAAVIRRYGGDSHLGYIRFGLGAGAEDFPQHGADGNCFAAWQAYGMSATFWAQYSANLTEYIASRAHRHHPGVQQIVALNPFSDPAAPFDVAYAVATAAARNGVGFGTENLGSGHYGRVIEACTTSEYWCKSFTTYAGTVPLQFQPINFTLQPGAHVAPLPDLLAYAIFNHAQLFEIYPQDWLTADDPNYPTYAAHHAAWKRAFTQAAAILGGS